MKTSPTKAGLFVLLLVFNLPLLSQNVGIGTATPQNGKLQVNGNRDAIALIAMLDSSQFGTGSIRFANVSRSAYSITVAGLSLGSTHAQSSLTIFSPQANIAHFTGDGKVGINQIDAQTTLDVNGTTRSLGLQIEGSNVLELGRGLTKQADAGKICYSCFGETNRLHLVGGGTNGGGTDRVIKLWSEGGLVVRGNVMPDATSSYSIGRNNNVWRSAFLDSAWANNYVLRNSSINIEGAPAEMLFKVNATPILSITSTGLAPTTDNSEYLGLPAKRFVAVYATTGTIQTSDATMKTNIISSPYGLDEVLQMKPVQFNWKENPTSQSEIGFLAQDMEKIVPEVVVNTGGATPLGMKYNELIPVLVKAIQEQQLRIEQLEKTLKQLQR